MDSSHLALFLNSTLATISVPDVQGIFLSIEAHMVCKNALSNIYFELGEFHELCDCLAHSLAHSWRTPFKADAHCKFGSICSLYCNAVFTIHPIAIPFLWNSSEEEMDFLQFLKEVIHFYWISVEHIRCKVR